MHRRSLIGGALNQTSSTVENSCPCQQQHCTQHLLLLPKSNIEKSLQQLQLQRLGKETSSSCSGAAELCDRSQEGATVRQTTDRPT